MTTRPVQPLRSVVPIWILTVIATLWFLREAKTLLLPIALSVLLTYALEPIVGWLQRHRVPRWAGAAVTLIALLALIVAGAYTLRDDLKSVLDAAPAALRRLREMIESNIGYPVDTEQSLAPDVNQAANAIFAIGGHIVVVLFLMFFLLMSGHQVRDRLVEISGPDAARRRTMSTIIGDINAQIQRYLLVLLFTATIVAAATWAALAALGVAHAMMWALLAGLLNSIPYFGPAIVSAGLFVVGLVQEGGITTALQMAGAALVITSIEGWLVTPPLMGKVERMNPLTVFIGLLLWTWVWDAWGTILAVPMLVIIKSVADHVDRFKPLGRLMAP